MATFYPAGGATYTLGSSISSTDTTILLSSFTEPVTGTPYTMALLNTSIVYATIAPRTTSSEFISFTGITQNADGTATLTGVTRGLAKKYPFTTDASYKLPHSGQSQFILSDAPQVFVKYPSKDNAETISGKFTFPAGGNANAPVSGASYSAPTDDLEYASKKYVDDVAIAGAPDATLTVKGIVEIATTAEIDAGTSTGGTGASVVARPDQLAASIYGTRLPTAGEKSALVGNNTDIAVGSGNKYATQTGLQKAAEVYAASSTGNDTYVVTLSPVPTSLVNGMHIFVKVDVGNTGAATLNVNSLGALAIVTGVSTALVTGDMLANGIYELIYNSTGTVWQLVNPASAILVATTYTNGTTTKDAADASTTQNIAHGLGRIPKKVKITALNFIVIGGGALGPETYNATTVYNGTTQSSVSGYKTGSNAVTVATTFTLNSADAVGTQTGVVTFDATNIIITWTKSNSPTGTYTLLWEAEG